jgi:predicted DNA binding protein
MGLIAEYEMHCEALPFIEVAREMPSATIEVELQYNHGERAVFLVYVTGTSKAEFSKALEASSFVGEYTFIGEAGDTLHYQVVPSKSEEDQLGDVIDDFSSFRSLATTEVIIERIRVQEEYWVQTGWFANREAFDELREFWQENGGLKLRRLTRDREPEPPGEGLSDRQREALRLAYEMGYFEIPSKASLEDIADELGVTSSAVSERLRRAQTHLIETSVAPMWPPLPSQSGTN